MRGDLGDGRSRRSRTLVAGSITRQSESLRQRFRSSISKWYQKQGLRVIGSLSTSELNARAIPDSSTKPFAALATFDVAIPKLKLRTFIPLRQGAVVAQVR